MKQTAPSRIWTWVADFISYNDSYDAKHISIQIINIR